MGKSLAVVAAGVKNLANKSAKATDEITGQISGIQHAIQEAATAIRIRSIRGIIGQNYEIATTFASAVEKQGATTSEIARNVPQSSAGTADLWSNIAGVPEAVSSTDAAVAHVLSAAGELCQQSEMLRGKFETFLATVNAV